MNHDHLAAPDPDHPGLAALRSALWAAGFEGERVRDVLQAEGDSLRPTPSQVEMLRRQLEAGTPLTTLITLFLFELPVPVDEAARALAPLGLDASAGMGLVSESSGEITAAVRLTPYGGFVFAGSVVSETAATDPRHVMGLTRSSIQLANLTSRRPVEAALDLGCGIGIQALLASRHASRVVATDVNPTACRFTAFNAALNRVDNVEVREGSYFEPVDEMRFDLVATNPPFVISPDNAFLYRDSGLPGDEVSLRVLTDVAAHLRPGGQATVLVSWGRNLADDWFARPAGWLDGLGCDALILHQVTQTALAHSLSWQGLEAVAPGADASGVDRWTEYLGGLGFDGVAYGAVVLRRRDGENWVRAEEIPGRYAGAAAAQLDALIAGQDKLIQLDRPEALLDRRLALVPNHRLEQTLRCRKGQFEVESALLTLEDGLPFGVHVDAFNAYLLSRMDGSRTLREALADAIDVTPEGTQASEIEPSATRTVRRMLELGFLRFAA
jgi:SAM-dependent methyltransferase